ncbi:MAG TPA: transcriptional activator protein, partial [Streptomyces sp.]
ALPVVLARAADPVSGRWHWATGSGLRPRDATLEAVRDLLGAVQTAQGDLDQGDPLLTDLDPGTLTVTGEAPTGPAAATTWSAVAARLRADGRDILLAPTPTPDLTAARIHATRVLLTTTPHRAH